MRRRNFLVLWEPGAAVAWPRVACAQQPAMPVIGFLNSGSPGPFADRVSAFRQGLAETGYIDGQNVAIEYRWAMDRSDQLPTLAVDFVRRQVAVIVATGGSTPALAAKAATATIPIVFTGGADPVDLGLVASLRDRPGGNATGVVNISAALDGKRLQILRELVPTAGLIAVLHDPLSPNAEGQKAKVEEAAHTLGQQIQIVDAGNEREFASAFAAIVQSRASALLVTAHPLFTSHRADLVALAAQNAIPASYAFRDFPMAGGLVSYGASQTDTYHQAGVYAGRILKGAKPAELPVMQPTKFELVINLKTAKALGLDIPLYLQQRADEVIE